MIMCLSGSCLDQMWNMYLSNVFIYMGRYIYICNFRNCHAFLDHSVLILCIHLLWTDILFEIMVPIGSLNLL